MSSEILYLLCGKRCKISLNLFTWYLWGISCEYLIGFFLSLCIAMSFKIHSSLWPLLLGCRSYSWTQTWSSLTWRRGTVSSCLTLAVVSCFVYPVPIIFLWWNLSRCYFRYPPLKQQYTQRPHFLTLLVNTNRGLTCRGFLLFKNDHVLIIQSMVLIHSRNTISLYI